MAVVHRGDWYHQLPPHVKEILLKLQAAGRKSFVVGGAVRDLYLGLKPKDFDLVSEASPEEIEGLFPKTIGVGRQFGIMVVVTEAGPVEVARFRTDGAYTDGRHPNEVTFTNPEEDAKRRDFTINALFYDPGTGEVIDYVGGVADLDQKRIRCVGEPAKRFEEDALRMLRAVRFEAQLAPRGFELDVSVTTAIRPLASRIALVSRERITQELDKIFQSSSPSLGLNALVVTGLWPYIFGTKAKEECIPRFDRLANYFTELTGQAPTLALFYSAAFAWLQADNFTAPKETKALFRRLPQLRQRLGGIENSELAGQKELLGDPHFPVLWAIAKAENELPYLDELAQKKAAWEKSGKLNPPALLRGEDFLALNIPAGPEIKKALELVRQAQLNEKIRTREEALALLTASKS
jgi:tRNA nucleotidyltransferase/poly(A) polymerase